MARRFESVLVSVSHALRPQVRTGRAHPRGASPGAIVRDAPAGSWTLLPSSKIAASMQQTRNVQACQVRRQVFVDLAAAANFDSHLLLPGPFATGYAVFSRPGQDKRILSPVLLTA